MVIQMQICHSWVILHVSSSVVRMKDGRGIIYARRVDHIFVNMIHDVTMYNASSQSNALNALDLRRLLSHAYIEKTEWILCASEISHERSNTSNVIARKLLHLFRET